MLAESQKRKEGFTIIEVMIVLAIGGLIMLIVFLAVPALQRNSRNNAYRDEASRLLSAYAEISANKGGSVLTASNSDTATDAQTVRNAANAKEFTRLVIELETGTTGPTRTQAVIRNGARCTSAAPTAANAATDPGGSRQIAILYTVETSSGSTIMQCQDS